MVTNYNSFINYNNFVLSRFIIILYNILYVLGISQESFMFTSISINLQHMEET